MVESVRIWDLIPIVVPVGPGINMRPSAMIVGGHVEVYNTLFAEAPGDVMVVGELPVRLNIPTEQINIPATSGITLEVNPVHTDM